MNGKEEGGVRRREFLKGVAAGAVGVGLAGAAVRSAFAEKKPVAKVKTRPLGRTKLDVSVVSFGCGELSADHLPLLRAAYERGINNFDTAWNYGGGQSEVALGSFVKTVKDRKKIVISTKASGFKVPRGSGKEVLTAIREKVEESLKKLQTDYLDIFFWPHGTKDPSQWKSEAMRDALKKLKEEGKIHFFGTSTHSNYAEVGRAAIKDGFHDVIMTVATIGTQKWEKADAGARAQTQNTRQMLSEAKAKDVGVIVMKAAKDKFWVRNVDDLLKGEFPEDSPFDKYQKLYSYMVRQEGVSTVVCGIHEP